MGRSPYHSYDNIPSTWRKHGRNLWRTKLSRYHVFGSSRWHRLGVRPFLRLPDLGQHQYPIVRQQPLQRDYCHQHCNSDMYLHVSSFLRALSPVLSFGKTVMGHGQLTIPALSVTYQPYEGGDEPVPSCACVTSTGTQYFSAPDPPINSCSGYATFVVNSKIP